MEENEKVLYDKLIDTLDKKVEHVKEICKTEIPTFQEIGHKFLDGDISSAEFKASSGGMGVYAERSGKEFMIRLRIPSGILDLTTLKLVQSFINDYKLDFIHFTTRQTIQLHNLPFDTMIEIMKQSLVHDIMTRGGGGNFPRNVSLSPLSGIQVEESFDVTPYAVLVNKYFASQINTYHLPRKFKVAFSNCEQDSANATIADLGFLAVIQDGHPYFKVFLGGSLGVSGEISVPYDELISPNDILYHVEALLNLFKEEGDYQNKGKARIRFIVKRMGSDAFLQCYKKHLKIVKEEKNLDFILNPLTDDNQEIATQKHSLTHPDVIPQKQDDLYCVVLHPQGGILYGSDFTNILTYIETIPSVEIRLGMDEGMYIRNLTAEQAEELLKLTAEIRNTTRLSRSISCIGTPICQIGIQSSQLLLGQILDYFKEQQLEDDILPSIHISGCVNSCARHQVSTIGFQGKKKRINSETKDAYALFIGGNTGLEETQLAKEYGDILAEAIPEFLYQLALLLKERKQDFPNFIQLYKDDFISLLEKYIIQS